MTQRERTMATVVGGIVVAGLGIFGVAWFASAYKAGEQEVESLKAQIVSADEEIAKVNKSRAKLDHWRRMSLPANLTIARGDYRKELEYSLRASGMTIEQFPDSSAQPSKSPIMHPSKPPVNKVPIYQGIEYTVRVKTSLKDLVTFLQSYQRTPKMQRIKKLTIERPGSSKDTGLLAVQMDFEAISILDAEAMASKKLATADKMDKKFMTLDLVADMYKVPFGVGAFAWYLSPQGRYMPSINPPSQARNYDDIQYKDMFYGTRRPPPPPPPEGGKKSEWNPAQYGTKAPDEVINMMRFSRFVSLITDDKGVSTGQVWDMYYNQKQRLSSSPGMRNFGMVQTAQGAHVVQGIIQKVENTDVIYRITLKASDATSSKWWRYPDHDGYISLHPDDLKQFISSGKVKEADKAHVYLISQKYWEDVLLKKGKELVEESRDKKSFRYLADPSLRGEELFADREIRIVKLSHAPPGGATKPSISVERVYPDQKTIYRVQTNHFKDMLATAAAEAGAAKGAGKGGIGGKGGGGKGGGKGFDTQAGAPLAAGDIDRVYCTPAYYWGYLWHHGIVKTDTSGGTFSFYKDMVCGEVIPQSNKDLVVFRVYDKYSKCPADPDLGTKDRWHEGLCVLKIDQFVQDSIHEPLPEARVKEFIRK